MLNLLSIFLKVSFFNLLTFKVQIQSSIQYMQWVWGEGYKNILHRMLCLLCVRVHACVCVCMRVCLISGHLLPINQIIFFHLFFCFLCLGKKKMNRFCCKLSCRLVKLVQQKPRSFSLHAPLTAVFPWWDNFVLRGCNRDSFSSISALALLLLSSVRTVLFSVKLNAVVTLLWLSSRLSSMY